MEAKECDPATGADCGPMAHAGHATFHDPIADAKRLAFEAQLQAQLRELTEREPHRVVKEGEGGGSDEKEKAGGGAAASSAGPATTMLDRARQGLKALRRKMEGLGGGGRRGRNNPEEPALGEVGYGDGSALDQDMKEACEEAAAAAAGAAKGKVVMEADPPHVHAPELFHPEAVTSMAEVRAQQQKQQQQMQQTRQEQAGANAGDDDNMVEKAARAVGNNLMAAVRGDKAGDEKKGGDTLSQQQREDQDMDRLEAMSMFFPE